MKNKIIIPAFFLAVMGILTGVFLAKTQSTALGAGASNTAPIFYQASSTAFSLTTTSQRLLATSTPTHRVAATIQPVNCTNGSAIFLKMQQDAVAASNGSSTMAVFASTTQEFKDYPNLPIVQGSVQGITGVGTCTVLVTEYRLPQ